MRWKLLALSSKPAGATAWSHAGALEPVLAHPAGIEPVAPRQKGAGCLRRAGAAVSAALFLTEPGVNRPRAPPPGGRPSHWRDSCHRTQSPGVRRKLKQMTLPHFLLSIHKKYKSEMGEK